MRFLLGILVLSIGFGVWAHEKQKHVSPRDASQEAERARRMALERSNERYLSNVKPIFQNSCFDCHSEQTRYPWYYKVPWVRGMIDGDIAEAKKHLDLTNNFPFRGHATPEEDLKAIEKVVRENEMPPFRYRVMHPGSGINQEEREAVIRWIEETRRDL